MEMPPEPVEMTPAYVKGGTSPAFLPHSQVEVVPERVNVVLPA
jgi:hypothetical protein